MKMMALFTYLKTRFSSRKGQGMVEYGLIIGVIVLIVVAVIGLLRTPLEELFQNIGDYITGQGPDPAAGP